MEAVKPSQSPPCLKSIRGPVLPYYHSYIPYQDPQVGELFGQRNKQDAFKSKGISKFHPIKVKPLTIRGPQLYTFTKLHNYYLEEHSIKTRDPPQVIEHIITTFSPFYLLFWSKPWIPCQATYASITESVSNSSDILIVDPLHFLPECMLQSYLIPCLILFPVNTPSSGFCINQ